MDISSKLVKIDKKTIFRTFNQYYFDLLNMMKKYGSSSQEFSKFYAYNYYLKKMNIKLFIKTWNETISMFYFDEIMKGNVAYFLNKDYSEDIKGNEAFAQKYSLETYIQYFKKTYDNLEKDLVAIFVEKIQQLTALSRSYFN
jgi:hypothetical protein